MKEINLPHLFDHDCHGVTARLYKWDEENLIPTYLEIEFYPRRYPGSTVATTIGVNLDESTDLAAIVTVLQETLKAYEAFVTLAN